MNKLECDQSINFNDSINDQSRIPIKTSKNNLLNKYTDLERKFDEFQNEFIKTSMLFYLIRKQYCYCI